MSDTKAFQPLATQEVTMFPHRPWQHFSFPGALITRVTTVTIVTAVQGMEGVWGGSSNPEDERCGPLMFKLWDNETNLRIALSHKHFYYQTSIKQFIYIHIYCIYTPTNTRTHMAMWNAHVGWLAENSLTCLFLHSHVRIKAAHFFMIFLFVYFGLKGFSVLQTN